MLKVGDSQLTILRETVEDVDSEDSDSDDAHLDLEKSGFKKSIVTEDLDFSEIETRRAESDARLARQKEKIA